MGEWSNLTQREKSNIIRFAIKNGVSDINQIRDTFNVYAKDSLANVDYNMAAAKASGFGSNGNGHYPDTFKKPNHPTFSDESIYHSEATPGGRWRGNTYEPSDYVLNRQGGWNNFLKGFYGQEQGTGAVPVFNGGVMLPEVTITPQYKEGGSIHIKHPGRLTALKERTGKTEAELWATGNAHTRKMITFARNARKWHKHEDGGSNWLPDFTYNPSMQSDNGRQLVQTILQNEGNQKAVQQKALQRQAEIEAQRKAVSEIYNGVPNPSAGYMSGTDPLLQTIIDMTPAGDAEMAIEAASELRNGNLKEAGLLGAVLLLPNIFNKSIKKLTDRRKLSKELSKLQLDQSVTDDEINSWIAERWYRNETQSLPPKIVDTFISDIENSNLKPYQIIHDLPLTIPSKSNTLIHVDKRLPLIPALEGFKPLPSGYDVPAIWWNRGYPYYPAPVDLTPIGHMLKVKEGDVRALGPLSRIPNEQNSIVVTEGILPYNILEGIRFNGDQSWFEKEIFRKSPTKYDYFKNVPAWLMYSTGGPLYPFSFQKNPYWKTPIVRY